jgi:hypothetical protein
MIVSITICLVFVAGFIFGYGVRAHHLASASSPLLLEIVSSVVGRCASNATAQIAAAGLDCEFAK